MVTVLPTIDLEKLQTNLKVLRAADNSILKLPLSISKLTELQILHFPHNRITEIHEEAFSGLEKLLELDLSCNQILKLPGSLGKLQSLQKLDVSFNISFSRCQLSLSSLAIS